MDVLREILSPDFLLRNAVYTNLLVGMLCPLVGIYLVLRRLVFMGVALPQISSTGIAVALSFHIWFGSNTAAAGAEDHGGEHALAFVGALGFNLVAVLILAWLERRGRGMVETRLGTAYVVSTAVSILLLAKCPQAERGWLNLFKGEIIAVSDQDLYLTLGTVLVVVVCVLFFQKEFLLVSFDPEMAVTLKKNLLLWDAFLFTLIGLTISVAVLNTGPVVAFGFLLIPPLIAHIFARNMTQFSLLAAAIGGVTAIASFAIAYKWDLPVGPTDVALLGLLYLVAVGMRKLFGLRVPTRA